jgi:hypothetical protein
MRIGCAVFLCMIFAATALSQTPTRAQCEQQFAPRSGLAGKDVMWVPTLDQLVTAMLRAAKVTPQDRVIDLGSGDGKIPIAAAKQFGAHALGIEYNPQLVQLAQCHARAEGIADKVEFRQGDIFATDFSAATVLTLYLSPTINLKLRPTILKMRPGTRVVANSFDMADWQPDELIESEIGNTKAYLWRVPAQVDGSWVFTAPGKGSGFGVLLHQEFQFLKATPASASQLAVRDGRLNGVEIEFTVIGLDSKPMRVKGRVEQSKIRANIEQGGRLVQYIGVRS